jgi:hypothetical protein
LKGSRGTDRARRAHWGVYGVHETFAVDRNGRIPCKHVGPINTRSLEDRLMPEIEKVLGAAL